MRHKMLCQKHEETSLLVILFSFWIFNAVEMWEREKNFGRQGKDQSLRNFLLIMQEKPKSSYPLEGLEALLNINASRSFI